jgi:hypothetical protein
MANFFKLYDGDLINIDDISIIILNKQTNKWSAEMKHNGSVELIKMDVREIVRQLGSRRMFELKNSDFINLENVISIVKNKTNNNWFANFRSGGEKEINEEDVNKINNLNHNLGA